jgi:hypothetical protein
MMGVASLAVLGMSATLADVQTDEVKEKPRLYRYESYWVFLRVHGGNQKVLAPALVDGILVGYGDDENQMYSPEGCSHANWWRANSLAGAMKVLEARALLRQNQRRRLRVITILATE